MAVDVYGSRRNYYNPCKYWYRKSVPNLRDNEKLIYEIKPDGYFFAKEREFVKDTRDLGNTMMVASTKVHIETMDDLGGIQKDDIVEFENEIWIVDYVEVKIRERQNAFSRKAGAITTLYLRK